jgi:predicted O-methyltransferase YrrM
MFHPIPERIRKRMSELEKIDERDRLDGTPQAERLRQIPPVTGRFLALLAASVPPGKMIEIGTSAGYSTLWLALAAKQTGHPFTTVELFENKVQMAAETFRLADIEDIVNLVQADARDYLAGEGDIALCFLDTEKELYQPCYDLAVPRLVRGGLLLADNVISHADDLADFIQRAADDPRVDAVVVPIGKGLLMARKS